MTLDEATRRNLELTQTIRSGDNGSLLSVLDATRSPMGSRLLRRWLNQPLLDVTRLDARLDAVQAWHDDTPPAPNCASCCARSAIWNGPPIARPSASPARMIWSRCAVRLSWRRTSRG
ncbi:MAG: hypothetical protein R2844_23180 [Caldilineales bacterium]